MSTRTGTISGTTAIVALTGPTRGEADATIVTIRTVDTEHTARMTDTRLVPPHDFEAGSSILNLAAAVARRFGAHTAVPGLNEAAVREALATARACVFVLFDGLGERQLATHARDGAIAQFRLRSLDSVFPSSTAPAMTSIACAAPPAAHGNPAWFMWSQAADAIVRTLPMDLRADHRQAVLARDTWSWQPWATRARASVFAVLPQQIAFSEFSRRSYAGATVLAYRSMDDAVELVAGALGASEGDTSVFVYLPHFDTVSHESGWQSEEASNVALRLDRWFAALVERLQALDALVLASADHGFVDVPVEDRLQLDEFPAVRDCLERPLCGEPRVPFCYVRADRRDRFARIVREALGDAFDVHEAGALLRAGWFGALPDGGECALDGRLGTHVLVPRRNVTLVDRLEGEQPMDFIGMHGGISEDEMRVPLVAAMRGVRVGG